jgi:hypothetical protein
MDKLIFWELNEINFEYVKYYINQGKLQNWKNFIDNHGLYTTISEKKYEELEPWIQWPTVRTGLTFKEHGVFRLGDIEHSKIHQHWEIIEDKGYSVAAISPINAVNNTKNSPFWIPDPWVDTRISGKGFIKRIAKAIKQAVNDNSQEKLEVSTIVAILEGLLTKSQLSSWPQYLSGMFGALKKQHWSKAIVLDRLLADIFIHFWKKYQPDFSVLFLNSGAHIQHHYMCSSAPYNGEVKNPAWYINNGKDPLLEILEMYDIVLNDLQKIKNTRLMISVGLQQVPYEKPTFYWRLKNHDEFLNKLGIKFKKTQLRMTRDFLIEFNNYSELVQAKKILSQVKSKDGREIFGEIDNRKDDLFVTLTYADDIGDHFSVFIDKQEYKDFRADIVFVAIKNGHHDTLGYYLDSDRRPNELEQKMPLKNLFGFVMDHFNCNKPYQEVKR